MRVWVRPAYGSCLFQPRYVHFLTGAMNAILFMQASTDFIQATIDSNKVAVFSKSYCPFCSDVSAHGTSAAPYILPANACMYLLSELCK